jgi:hypothetical protein
MFRNYDTVTAPLDPFFVGIPDKCVLLFQKKQGREWWHFTLVSGWLFVEDDFDDNV